MAIKLHKAGFEHAMSLAKNGFEVEHDENNWDEVKATRNEEVRFLDTHTLDEYGLWFLGIDSDAGQEESSKYRYPYGDFSVLHKSALLVIEKEAAKNGHRDIQEAAKKLLEIVNRTKR